MLNGGLAGKLILFSIPLAFSSILQQLFNSADAAIFRSRGDSKSPLIALMISGAVSVMLNVLFVVGCGMNVMGVALATVIATALSGGSTSADSLT